MSVIRSSETVRQHRVLTTLIHGRAIHAALTTVSVIRNLHRNLLPDSFDNGILVSLDRGSRRNPLTINFPSIKLLSVIRGFESVRQHRVLTTLIHGFTSHGSATTISVITDLHLALLPDSFHYGVFSDRNLGTRSYLFAVYFPSLKFLGGIRSSESVIKQGIFTTLLQGLAHHFATATVRTIGNRHLDVLPDGLNSSVFLNDDFSACSVLSFAYLPGLELFVCRGSKSITQNLVL